MIGFDNGVVINVLFGCLPCFNALGVDRVDLLEVAGEGSVDSGELYNEAKPLRQTIPLSLVMAGVRAPWTTAGEAIEGEGWLLETSGCLLLLVSVQAGTRLPVLLDTIEIP